MSHHSEGSSCKTMLFLLKATKSCRAEGFWVSVTAPFLEVQKKPLTEISGFFTFGGPTWTRTRDQRIMRKNTQKDLNVYAA
jgi:hypothetical protein